MQGNSIGAIWGRDMAMPAKTYRKEQKACLKNEALFDAKISQLVKKITVVLDKISVLTNDHSHRNPESYGDDIFYDASEVCLANPEVSEGCVYYDAFDQSVSELEKECDNLFQNAQKVTESRRENTQRLAKIQDKLIEHVIELEGRFQIEQQVAEDEFKELVKDLSSAVVACLAVSAMASAGVSIGSLPMITTCVFMGGTRLLKSDVRNSLPEPIVKVVNHVIDALPYGFLGVTMATTGAVKGLCQVTAAVGLNSVTRTETTQRLIKQIVGDRLGKDIVDVLMRAIAIVTGLYIGNRFSDGVNSTNGQAVAIPQQKRLLSGLEQNHFALQTLHTIGSKAVGLAAFKAGVVFNKGLSILPGAYGVPIPTPSVNVSSLNGTVTAIEPEAIDYTKEQLECAERLNVEPYNCNPYGVYTIRDRTVKNVISQQFSSSFQNLKPYELLNIKNLLLRGYSSPVPFNFAKYEFDGLENLNKIVMDTFRLSWVPKDTFKGLEKLDTLSLSYCYSQSLKFDTNFIDDLPQLKHLVVFDTPALFSETQFEKFQNRTDLQLYFGKPNTMSYFNSRSGLIIGGHQIHFPNIINYFHSGNDYRGTYIVPSKLTVPDHVNVNSITRSQYEFLCSSLSQKDFDFCDWPFNHTTPSPPHHTNGHKFSNAQIAEIAIGVTGFVVISGCIVFVVAKKASQSNRNSQERQRLIPTRSRQSSRTYRGSSRNTSSTNHAWRSSQTEQGEPRNKATFNKASGENASKSTHNQDGPPDYSTVVNDPYGYDCKLPSYKTAVQKGREEFKNRDRTVSI